jgi:hypothetical protein
VATECRTLMAAHEGLRCTSLAKLRAGTCTRPDSMTCDDCKALLGQSTSMPPHHSLLMRDSHLLERGAVETHRCRICHTRWYRFTPDLTFSGPPQVWCVLPHAVLRHRAPPSVDGPKVVEEHPAPHQVAPQ